MIEVTALSGQQIIKRMIDLIKEKAPDARLYLFGSRARGDFQERSDFDFVIRQEGLSASLYFDLIERVDNGRP